MNLCQRLTAPERRFPSAEAADLDRKGAADFQWQLGKTSRKELRPLSPLRSRGPEQKTLRGEVIST